MTRYGPTPPHSSPPYGGYPQYPGRPPQETQDADHLRMLSIFHYVMAGLAAFGSCMSVLQIGVFSMMWEDMSSHPGGGPPGGFEVLIMAIPVIFGVLGLVVAALLVAAAGFLKQRVNYRFCFVAACVSCLFMPLGTVLGVFTIMVLNRPSVKAMFAAG